MHGRPDPSNRAPSLRSFYGVNGLTQHAPPSGFVLYSKATVASPRWWNRVHPCQHILELINVVWLAVGGCCWGFQLGVASNLPPCSATDTLGLVRLGATDLAAGPCGRVFSVPSFLFRVLGAGRHRTLHAAGL